jgi:molybdopterin biosynthesis enzyme
MAPDPTQRIARLAPLEEVQGRIDQLVAPVAPREIAITHALGRVLAHDLTLPPCPPRALALRDGWAVASELSGDASSFAPVALSAVRIDAGEPMPEAADAVAALDLVETRAGQAEIMAQVAPGEGVLPAGGDVPGSGAFLPAGASLTPVRLAVLAAAGVSRALVREPCVRLVKARPGPEAFIGAAAELLARAMAAEGAAALEDDATLEDALRDDESDAVVAIGGTGGGRNDASIRTLARLGRVEVHGIALSPGETAAFGFAGERPVLLVPGRLDAALAVWLLLGRRLLARLCGGTEPSPAMLARLTRKVSSPLGLAELVPVRLHGQEAEPLASGYLPLQFLARSDGWFLVGPDHEGHPGGTEVMVRRWP